MIASPAPLIAIEFQGTDANACVTGGTASQDERTITRHVEINCVNSRSE